MGKVHFSIVRGRTLYIRICNYLLVNEPTVRLDVTLVVKGL